MRTGRGGRDAIADADDRPALRTSVPRDWTDVSAASLSVRGARTRVRFGVGSRARTVSWRMLRDGKDEHRERVAVVLRRPRHLRIGTVVARSSCWTPPDLSGTAVV
jgi:hypothetical protein